MARGISLATAWLAMGALSVPMFACGTSDQFKVTFPPAIAVRIDDNVATLKTTPADKDCIKFDQAETGETVSFTKVVKITNTGHTPALKPLCINHTWVAPSDKTQLKMTIASGKTVDEKACPKGIALAPNATLVLNVTYSPKPDELAEGTATLTIAHNGGKQLTPARFCFGVNSLSAQVKLSQAEDKFINASSSNPPEHCYQIYNTGNATLTFKQARFGTANSQYTITKTPQDGDQIEGKGSPDNADGQKKLEVCVRYDPNKTPDDEDVTLEILTSDQSTSTSSIKITATTEAGGYSLSCSANNLTGFDFTGGNVAKPQTCIVAVEGQAPFTFTSMEVVAEDPNLDAAAKAAYSCEHLYNGGPVPGVLAVPPGKSGDIVCKYTPLGDGSAPPAAHLVVNYKQANVPNAFSLPIMAGTCDIPSLALGPDASQQLWFLATLGQTNSNTAIVANQSCGALQLVQACVTAANISSENACDNPDLASKEYSVSLLSGGKPGPFSLVSVPPWGLQSLQITFKPLSAKQNLLALLHVRYCSGKWDDAAKQCVGGLLVTQKLPLAGSQDAELKQPTFKLETPGDVAVGKPSVISGKVADNTWDAKNFVWFLSERPAGSSAWLYGATTDKPSLTFVPDKAGHYTLIGMAQTYDDVDASKMAWSAQATVSFDAK